MIRNITSEIEELVAAAWKECPNCKYHIYNGDVLSRWPGLPAGVKFEPTDLELLGHLKEVGRAASHVLIDDFIPTIEEVEGICYTHPENLPGIKMDGSRSHFFHRISNAYDVGPRKRRKINHTDSDEQIRWHKTGTSSPILDNGVIKGWKKILVLHKGKKVKTNWTLHQYHLGVDKDEKHGELVVSRVFWQLKSNEPRKSQMQAADVESRPSAVKIDPTTPSTYPPQPRRVSGSPFETEQYQDEEEPGSSAFQRKAEAGTSLSACYAALPNLDEHPLGNDDIHERPLPLDSPGMDALPALSDMDYNTCFGTPADLFTLTDNLDWLYGNRA